MKYDYYWSRHPGEWVDSKTGEPIKKEFTGSIRDWYRELGQLVAKIINDDFLHSLGQDWNDTPMILVNQDVCILLQVTDFWASTANVTYANISLDYGPQIGSLLGKYKVYPIIEDDTVIIIQNTTNEKTLKVLGFKEQG